MTSDPDFHLSVAMKQISSEPFLKYTSCGDSVDVVLEGQEPLVLGFPQFLEQTLRNSRDCWELLRAAPQIQIRDQR